jgi:hypothetical protein
LAQGGLESGTEAVGKGNEPRFDADFRIRQSALRREIGGHSPHVSRILSADLLKRLSDEEFRTTDGRIENPPIRSIGDGSYAATGAGHRARFDPMSLAKPVIT